MANSPLAFEDVLLRTLAAMLAGFLIGLDRESRGRAAGMRTTMLVCVASALAIITANAFYAQVSTSLGGQSWRPDPSRVAQGILAGMGFLGAGAILRQGTVIRGLTTAAGLWFVTIIGLTFGFGYYLIGGFGTLIALIILFVLPLLENLLHVEHYATLGLTMKPDTVNTETIQQEIEAAGAKIARVDIHYDVEQQRKTAQYQLKFRAKHPLNYPQQVLDRLLHLEGILQVSWDTES